MHKTPINLEAYIREIRSKLKFAGIEEAGIEARILLEDLVLVNCNQGSGRDPISLHSALISNSSLIITEECKKLVDDALVRRCAGEPLGRILGYRDFWKNRFYISPETLEPRPETEILVEEVLKKFPPANQSSRLKILDLGTGTGCIVLSLLDEYRIEKGAHGIGVDISAGACDTARKNAENLGFEVGVEKEINFIVSSWCSEIPIDSKFDIIVSNPPYIPEGEIEYLDKNVRDYDPVMALNGGPDGLNPYRDLLKVLKNFLTPQGWVFFECGLGQAKNIKDIAKKSGALKVEIIKDLCGIERVLNISYGDK